VRKLVAAIVIGAAISLGAQAVSTYSVVRTFPVGGDGSWDYIVPDPASHRLFIGRQNRVMVVDEESGALVGEVTGIQGAHGTALAPASGTAPSGTQHLLFGSHCGSYPANRDDGPQSRSDRVHWPPCASHGVWLLHPVSSNPHSSTLCR
jgi:hypothetical protein